MNKTHWLRFMEVLKKKITTSYALVCGIDEKNALKICPVQYNTARNIEILLPNIIKQNNIQYIFLLIHYTLYILQCTLSHHPEFNI